MKSLIDNRDIPLLKADLFDLEIKIAQFFKENGDPYRKRAAEIYGIPEDRVTPDQRRVVKMDMLQDMYSSQPLKGPLLGTLGDINE
jgi:hypothetical protein